MDFISKGSSLLNILSLIFFLIIYYNSQSAKIRPFLVKKNSRYIRNVFLLIFIVFTFWAGDFFHMYFDFEALQIGKTKTYEDVYIWIAGVLSPNYFIFRVLIWGSGLLIINQMFKHLPISRDLLWLMFVVYSLIWFSYGRVSLAMALMFYGVALYMSSSCSGKKYRLFGLLVILVSFYFHKSAIFGIMVIFASLTFKSINSKILMAAIIFISLVFIVSSNLLTEFLTTDSSKYSDLQESIYSAQNYMMMERLERGIAARILKLLEVLPYLVVSYLSLKIINSSSSNAIPSIIKVFMLSLVFIVLSYILLSLNFTVNTETVAGRFLRFGFIPCSILMAYFWQNRIHYKMLNKVFFIGILSTVSQFLYSFYNTFFM